MLTGVGLNRALLLRWYGIYGKLYVMRCVSEP
jgi:hypothetical protein